MQKKLLLSTICLGALVAASPAFAQSANINDQMRALQAQIRQQQHLLEQQQQQLKALMDQVNASQVQAKQAQDTAKAAEAKIDTAAAQAAKAKASGPRATMSPTNVVGWESADGRNSIQFHGKIHYDIGISGYNPDTAATPVQHMLTGVNMRRLEVGFTARIEEDWNAAMSYQVVTGGGDSFTDAKKGFNTAKLFYTGFKPLSIETGYQTPPFTLDDAFGSENYIFAEHPTAQSVTNIAGGTGRGTPLLLRAGQGRWFASAGLTTYKAGTDHSTRAPWNVGARATYHVWQSGDDHVQLGAQYQRLLQPEATQKFSYWPEYRLDENKTMNTTLGSAAQPVSEADTKGLEFALSWNSLFVGGEYEFLHVDRRNLGSNDFQGYYVEAAYVLTGERRRYNPRSAGYGKPIPLHPFSLSRGGWGAWEVGVRWGSMDLNDRWNRGTTDRRAVNGGHQDDFILGLNWYPTANNKFQFNWIRGGLYDRYSTARGNPSTGAKWDLFLLRSGFSF